MLRSEVLNQRCEHFRALRESGMRDAMLSRVPIPSHFEMKGVQGLIHYIYHDEILAPFDPDVRARVFWVLVGDDG